MTRSLYARSALLLLFFGVIGLGLYLYKNLDSILQHQIRQSLQEYGVEDYRLEKPRLAEGLMAVDRLWLRGNYDNHAYEAELRSLEVHYNWRTFLTLKVQTVSMSNLDIAISQTSPAPNAGQSPADFDLESLVPQELVSQLPLQALEIGAWEVDYRSPEIPRLFVAGKLLYRGNLEVAAETVLGGNNVTVDLQSNESNASTELVIALHNAEREAIALTAQLQPLSRDRWDWHLQGNWYYTPLLDWLRNLSTEAGLSLETSIPDDLIVIGSGEFTAQVRHPNTLSFPLAGDQSTFESLEANVQIINNIVQLDYRGIIEGMTGSLDSSLALLDGQLQIDVKPFHLTGKLWAERLTSSEDTRHWLRWQETVSVTWDSREPFNATYHGGKWSAQLHNTLLELGDSQSQLRLEKLDFEASLTTGEPLLLSTQLNTSIKTRLRKEQLPQLEFALTQMGNVEQSSIRVNLEDTAESFSCGLEGTADLITGGGNYQFSARSLDLPYFTSAVVPALSNIGLFKTDLEILSGSINLDTSLNTTDFNIESWTQESQLAIENVSGTYDEYDFEKLALAAHWTGVQRWKTVQPVEFSLEKLDMGFVVHDIVARTSLPKATAIEQPSLRIDAFSADLFGGQLFLPEPGNWDFSAPSNTLTLQANGWQLAEMVALQQAEDIQAEGTLEGALPFTMSEGRIIIEKGYLRALPPGGTIRYMPNDASRALSKNNKELEMTLDLLSDFRYEVLSSAVELDESGNLLLGLSLAGHHPTRFRGHPVNFNINLEQNLDPLLQSLRLSDKLTERIENRLQ